VGAYNQQFIHSQKVTSEEGGEGAGKNQFAVRFFEDLK
jgi:hypothetical protein